MKTSFRSAALMLALTFMVSCQSDDEAIDNHKGYVEDEITFASTTIFEVIDEIGVQKPDLLIQTVKSLGDRYMPTPSGGKHYPWMWLVKCNGKEYIYIFDVLSSMIKGSYFLFTLSGDLVEADADGTYNNLGRLDQDRILLWPVVIKE